MTPRLTCLGCLAALLLAATPHAASAQFTTLVTPPRRPQRPAIAARGDTVPRAQLDTVRPTELPDLKTWVDSAATALSVPSAGTPRAPARDSVPPGPSAPTCPCRRATPIRPDTTGAPPARPDSARGRPPQREDPDSPRA